MALLKLLRKRRWERKRFFLGRVPDWAWGSNDFLSGMDRGVWSSKEGLAAKSESSFG